MKHWSSKSKDGLLDFSINLYRFYWGTSLLGLHFAISCFHNGHLLEKVRLLEKTSYVFCYTFGSFNCSWITEHV